MAIPTLGYKSRTDAALDLKRQGKSLREIADLLGVPSTTVSALLSSAKRQRDHVENNATVVVPKHVLRALCPAAERRAIHVHELVRRLLETIADDSLVDSVLDDVEDLERHELDKTEAA